MMQKKKLILFSTLCLAEFVMNFINSLQGVLLTDFIYFYHLESASQGLMGTFLNLGNLTATILIIIFASKIKKQYALLVSGACMVVSTICIGLKPSFAIFIMLYTLMGLGSGSWGSFGVSTVTGLFNNEAKYPGMIKGFFGLGGLAAPIVLRFFRRNMEWNQVAIADGLIVLFAVGLYAITLFATRKDIVIREDAGEKFSLAYMKEFFGSRRNIALFTAEFCYQSFQNGIATWLIRYNEFELNNAELGAGMLSSFWVGVTLSRFIVTRLKISPVKLISFGCFVSAVTLVIGVLSHHSVILFIAIVIGAFSSGAVTPLAFHLSTSWNKGILIPTAIIGLAASIGPMLTAPVIAFFASGNLNTGLLVVAAFVLIAGAAMIPLMKK